MGSLFFPPPFSVSSVSSVVPKMSDSIERPVAEDTTPAPAVPPVLPDVDSAGGPAAQQGNDAAGLHNEAAPPRG
jgi:hypothetical protein